MLCVRIASNAIFVDNDDVSILLSDDHSDQRYDTLTNLCTKNKNKILLCQCKYTLPHFISKSKAIS